MGSLPDSPLLPESSYTVESTPEMNGVGNLRNSAPASTPEHGNTNGEASSMSEAQVSIPESDRRRLREESVANWMERDQWGLEEGSAPTSEDLTEQCRSIRKLRILSVLDSSVMDSLTLLPTPGTAGNNQEQTQPAEDSESPSHSPRSPTG
ncbi:hypothetical protein B0T16DRAFT_385416 [Cercophora newfieldiana]|uniref:Uncharacterized protein n=1 Tax=Cercophora newfieldiana TaxID=92897 RepID=A0AA39YQC0_9PEZI|nr:hypothetical protein B0T16DRAFT_385416 [Cercophora newfieldiana]